jgi:predicted ferric reductase
VNDSLKYHPGQFIFISFQQNGISTESHPFTIASSPNSKNIRLCLKIVSDYTGSLIDLKKNTKAIIQGPYGHLYKAFETNKNLILIAGGVGVTPFMSMVETEIIKPQNRQVNLFYTARSVDSAFNNSRFLELSSQNNNFNYFPVFTDKSSRLDAKYIQKQSPLFLSSNIIICGPQIMMTDLKNQLISLNVNPQNIFFEDFSLN